jgi:hypothetical protein
VLKVTTPEVDTVNNDASLPPIVKVRASPSASVAVIVNADV